MKIFRSLAIVLTFACAPAWGQSMTTTDGGPPIICPQGFMTASLNCTGSYCDNITMTCSRNLREVTGLFWTRFVERDGANTATCGAAGGPDGFMSGIACSGDYCDDIALQCTRLTLFRPDFTDCGTVEFSEEQGVQRWPSVFHFPVSIRCSGTHCDNKRLTACRLIRR